MDTQSKSLSTKEQKIDNMVRKTSKYTLIILVIIVIAILVVRIIKKISYEKNNKAVKKSGVDKVDEYYKPFPAWGNIEPVEYYYPEKNGYPVPGTKNCQVYTYENIYAENEYGSDLDVITNSKPNVNTVFKDYVEGLNHIGGFIGENVGCLTPDQIYAQHVSRKCKSSNSKYTICYDSSGSVTEPGSSVTSTAECSSKGLPKCAGRLGSISLNFEIEDSKINKQTRCIGVSTIKVPNTKLFNSPILSYYKEDGIIQVDDSLDDNGVYPVTLISDRCNTRSSKQKFLITSYRYGVVQESGGDTSKQKTTFSVDNKGIYTSIIYKPLNAYLDMEFSGTGGIASLSLGASGTGYTNGEQDITLFGSYPNAKGGKVIVVTEGGKGAVGSLIVSEIGEGYQQGVSGYINGTLGVSATFVISSVYGTNPQFVLRNIPFPNPDFVDIKWLYFPSLDLSSTRFPTLQRCNFINPYSEGKTFKKKYSLLSSPLGKDTVFLQSNFVDSKVDIKSNYCSKGVSFYPDVTFRNLTEGGRLNPFNDYKYNVFNSQGKTPTQQETKPFILKSKTPINFSPGEVFTDGSAKILVENYSQYICQFPGEYFRNNTGAVKGISPNPKFTPGKDQIYKQSSPGLISKVSVKSQPARQLGFVTGSYQGVSASGGKGTCASFDIEVFPQFNVRELSYEPNLKVIGITNQGSNYIAGDILTIYPSEIGLSVVEPFPTLTVQQTELEKFLFTSIPMNSQYSLDPEPEVELTRVNYPNRDFTVVGTIDSGNNVEIFPDLILDKGYGMKPGHTMWMMQLDLNTGGFISQQYYANLVQYINSIKNIPNTSSNAYPALIGIVPNSIQVNEYSGDMQAPVTLGVPQNKSIQFNFTGDSPMKLNPSPQQIVYGGQVTFGNATLIEEFAGLNINDEKKITNYFLSQKTGIDTDVIFLKSLQYPSLGYSESNNNEVNTNTPIKLGKFIPYSSFTPMINSSAQNKEISSLNYYTLQNIREDIGLPDATDKILYNNNYTQIIPYGLDELYSANIKYNKGNDSDNPYNNVTQG